MSTCVCKTGPKGLGPRCTKAAKLGSKFCGIHLKKCLGEFAQQQRMVQPVLKQQRMVQPVLKQQRMVQPVLLKQQRMVQPKAVKAVKKVQPRGCVEQTVKKYVDRLSPPFPANECCGQVKRGNNGEMWVSKENVKGVCSWKLYSDYSLSCKVPPCVLLS